MELGPRPSQASSLSVPIYCRMCEFEMDEHMQLCLTKVGYVPVVYYPVSRSVPAEGGLGGDPAIKFSSGYKWQRMCISHRDIYTRAWSPPCELHSNTCTWLEGWTCPREGIVMHLNLPWANAWAISSELPFNICTIVDLIICAWRRNAVASSSRWSIISSSIHYRWLGFVLNGEMFETSSVAVARLLACSRWLSVLISLRAVSSLIFHQGVHWWIDCNKGWPGPALLAELSSH